MLERDRTSKRRRRVADSPTYLCSIRWILPKTTLTLNLFLDLETRSFSSHSSPLTSPFLADTSSFPFRLPFPQSPLLASLATQQQQQQPVRLLPSQQSSLLLLSSQPPNLLHRQSLSLSRSRRIPNPTRRRRRSEPRKFPTQCFRIQEEVERLERRGWKWEWKWWERGGEGEG